MNKSIKLEKCAKCGCYPTLENKRASFYWSGYVIFCPQCKEPNDMNTIYFEQSQAIHKWNIKQKSLAR